MMDALWDLLMALEARLPDTLVPVVIKVCHLCIAVVLGLDDGAGLLRPLRYGRIEGPFDGEVDFRGGNQKVDEAQTLWSVSR